MIEPAEATAPKVSGPPGVRTMRSPMFRTIVALVLLIIGVWLMSTFIMRQASAEDGQYAIDFADFHVAAERMAAGETPYAPEMLAGPTAAQGQDRYRYPPLFAQMLRPMAELSLDTAATIWLFLQAAAIYLSLWIATGIGGARRNAERALWCGVAAAFFLPVFDTLWKGNVSGVLALATVMVAAGGVAAGVGAGFGALLKAVPGTLVPATLVMDVRARVTVIVVMAAGVAVSFLLAPGAWLDYPTVVLNMVAGSADYANNLAPSVMAARGGLPDIAVGLLRAGILGLALACVIVSVLLARHRSGLPAAALLGAIALLLVPNSFWYHYLVVLLPFAAMAWPRASGPQRAALFGSGALVSLSLVWLPMALLAGTAMAASSLYVLWPAGSLTGRAAAMARTMGPSDL